MLPASEVAPPAPHAETKAPAQSEPALEYSCSVSVEALGATYEGRAGGTASSTDVFAAAAEADACKKLFDATGIDCKDDSRVLRSTMSQVKMAKSVTTAIKVVRLTTVAAVQKGEASSDLGGREACLAAVDIACRTAPVGSKCVPKHVSCEADATGKMWSCGPIRRQPFRGEALVPPDPAQPGDPFSDI